MRQREAGDPGDEGKFLRVGLFQVEPDRLGGFLRGKAMQPPIAAGIGFQHVRVFSTTEQYQRQQYQCRRLWQARLGRAEQPIRQPV